MTDKEKETIEKLEKFTKNDFSNPLGWSGYYDTELNELSRAIKISLNLIENQQKEIKYWKDEYDKEVTENIAYITKIENQDNRIKELEKELKERKSYNKGAKEALRVSEELEKFYNEEASRLETELEGKDKMIEDMAEWIYSNISLCKMSEIAMLAGYDIKKFIMGISDEEAKSIIKRYFEKKEEG